MESKKIACKLLAGHMQAGGGENQNVVGVTTK